MIPHYVLGLDSLSVLSTPGSQVTPHQLNITLGKHPATIGDQLGPTPMTRSWHDIRLKVVMGWLEWSTLIGPDPSRYSALLGLTLLCHKNT